MTQPAEICLMKYASERVSRYSLNLTSLRSSLNINPTRKRHIHRNVPLCLSFVRTEWDHLSDHTPFKYIGALISELEMKNIANPAGKRQQDTSCSQHTVRFLQHHRWVSLYPLPVVPHFGKAPRRQAATVSSWTWNTSPSAGFSHCSEGGLILRDPSELNPLKCPLGFCLHVSAEIRSIHRALLQRALECSGFDRHPSPSAKGWIISHTHTSLVRTHTWSPTHTELHPPTQIPISKHPWPSSNTVLH